MIAPEEKRRQAEVTFDAIWKLRQSGMDSLFRDLADHFAPIRARFYLTSTNKADWRSPKIIDSTGPRAADTLAAGMASGVSPQNQDWFKVVLADDALMEREDVKEWCDEATNRVSAALQRSNFYQAAPTVYFDQGIFGTAACACEEDATDIVRFYPHPIGSYAIGQDSRSRVNMFGREYCWPLRTVVEKYGTEGLSDAMQTAAEDPKKLDVTEVQIRELVYPNPEYREGSDEKTALAFAYCVWEKTSGEKFLLEGGFYEFPELVPRWHLRDASSPWGYSPGMESLGDNMMLQKMTSDGLKALAKELDPPLTGPASLQNRKKSLLPGDFTADDSTSAQAGLRPIHETRVNLANVLAWRQDTRTQVERAFHVDLFLMLTQDTRSQPATAEEWRQRLQEKIQALGPVLARQNDDWLKPMIERVMAIMIRRSQMAWKLGQDGLLPVPPPAMQGADWHPEFISSLAQAQKAVSTANTEHFLTYMVGLAGEAQDPSILDPIDFPEAASVLAASAGVPEKIVRSAAAVLARQTQRAQAQAAQQAQENAQGMATAAQKASETDVSKDSLLKRVLARAGSN